MKKKIETAELQQIDIREVSIKIKGLSPIIMHRFSEIQKKQMLDSMMKVAQQKKKKDPEKEYEEAKYFTADGKPAIPVIAFKKAMIRASKSLGLKMTDARTSFFVLGEYSEQAGCEVVEVKGQFSMREDIVRVAKGGTDLRYRPQLNNWTASIRIGYNNSQISFDQLVNMLNLAGYGIGIGDWRPEKDGSFGRFTIIK